MYKYQCDINCDFLHATPEYDVIKQAELMGWYDEILLEFENYDIYQRGIIGFEKLKEYLSPFMHYSISDAEYDRKQEYDKPTTEDLLCYNNFSSWFVEKIAKEYKVSGMDTLHQLAYDTWNDFKNLKR